MTTNLHEIPLQSVVAEALSEPIGREALVRYAQASGDLNPLHLDPEFARKAGFDDVIVHGMLGMAILGRLLTSHFPPTALRRYEARFQAVIPVDSRLRCRAILSERSEAEAQLALQVLVEGKDSVAISGSAMIALETGA